MYGKMERKKTKTLEEINRRTLKVIDLKENEKK